MARVSTKSNPFLSHEDGMINVAEIANLTRFIDKECIKAGLIANEIYYSGRVIPKFSSERSETNPEMFQKKRAQVIKNRARMPAAGSRLKMQVLLRGYKNMQDVLAESVIEEFETAKYAVERHNVVATKHSSNIKANAMKRRETEGKVFDRAVEKFLDILESGGIQEQDIAIGMSPMGKTVVIKVGKDYLSIGKANEERFNKIIEAQEEPEVKKKPPQRRLQTRK